MGWTLHRRAPELYRSYRDVTAIDASKADVWSLGVLAYSVRKGSFAHVQLVGVKVDPHNLQKEGFHFDQFGDAPCRVSEGGTP